jgi:uncharacterized membrane protein YhiD involved in acid resistance
MESRRRFFSVIFTQSAAFLTLATSLAGQRTPTKARQPLEQKDKEEDENSPKIDPKRVLEENQKDIKKKIEKLYKLAGELKAEVDKTDAVQVLSMAMLKKAEEIEKLAKEIRSRAIG